MADLIAIGYPDETTADEAAKEVLRLADDLIIQPDAVAVISRDTEGKYHVHTMHNEVATGTLWGVFWGVFWGLLFGFLFFVPVVGAVVGAALGALMGLIAKLGISEEFQRQVRELLRPGTSALFMVIEKMTTDKAVAALSRFGGTVLKTSLSEQAERELQAALQGSSVPATTP